jgi:hypothetical protein
MAVIVKYVVVHDGRDDMIFSTKKEAEAYDKMLDIAERLHAFLHTAELNIADETLDSLSFFMAQHREQLGALLKGGQLQPPTASASTTLPPATEAAVTPAEPQESKAASSPRVAKPKAAA